MKVNKVLVLWTTWFLMGCASTVVPIYGSDTVLIIVDSSTPDGAVPTNDASEASATDATDSATTDAQAEASADASDAVIFDATDASDVADVVLPDAGPCVVPPTVGPVSPTSVVSEVATTFAVSYAGCADIVNCQLVERSTLLGDMSLSSGTASLTFTLSNGTHALQVQCHDAAGNWGYGPVTTVNVELIGSITASLAASPSGTVIAVKNQANIPSVGVVFTASPYSDGVLPSVRLAGMGNVSGSFTPSDLAQVVTSCALFNGSTQIGLAATPDAATGALNFTRMGLTIPRGTSIALEMRCTADSVVAQPGGDSYAIGIASAGDIRAEFPSGEPMGTACTADIQQNATSMPLVVVRVLDHGTLTIEPFEMRASTILVAGGDVWQNMAQFRATARYEGATMDLMSLHAVGDSANFAVDPRTGGGIAVARDGVVLGSGILPAGYNEERDIDLSAHPIVIPRDSSATFQLWARIANVQSSSSTGGATMGVCSSGNVVALGLNGSDGTSYSWDPSYRNHYSVRTTGLVSGERLYADSRGTAAGNLFVIRRTKPTIVRQALSLTTLGNGIYQSVYRVQMSADPAGSAALKKFTLDFTIARATGSRLDFTGFRLLRNGFEMNGADYRIVTASGRDLMGASLGVLTTHEYVVVSFTGDTIMGVYSGEEILTGSGNIYDIQSRVDGAISGDSVAVSLARSGSPARVYTGWLTPATNPATSGTLTLTGPHLADTGSVVPFFATFIWSDMSEVPHNGIEHIMGGSRDWTDDLYLEDLTQTQVLSR